jgi:hypothetical protein
LAQLLQLALHHMAMTLGVDPLRELTPLDPAKLLLGLQLGLKNRQFQGFFQAVSKNEVAMQNLQIV